MTINYSLYGGRKRYRELVLFNEELLDENSPLGSIISREAIRRSSDHLEKVINEHLVNAGAAARIHN